MSISSRPVSQPFPLNTRPLAPPSAVASNAMPPRPQGGDLIDQSVFSSQNNFDAFYRRYQQDDPVAGLRQLFQPIQATGAGRTIGVIDSPGGHGKLVQAVAAGDVNGIAPGANTFFMEDPGQAFELPEGDSVEAFRRYTVKNVVNGYDTYTQSLSQLLNQAPAGLTSVNLSVGANKLVHLDNLYTTLEMKAGDLGGTPVTDPTVAPGATQPIPTGTDTLIPIGSQTPPLSTLPPNSPPVPPSTDPNAYLFPQARQAILGPNADALTPEQKYQRIQAFHNQALNSTQDDEAALKRWQDITRFSQQQRNVNVFVAAGNSRTTQPASSARGVTPFDNLDFSKVRVDADAELQQLANSPYVVSVAATKTNQTPFNLSDDQLAVYSSRGDGRSFNPTIAAPAARVLNNVGLENIAEDPILEQTLGDDPTVEGNRAIFNGTSSASPFMAGVDTLIAQQNPNLTAAQRVQLMKNTASPIAGSTVRDSAHGAANPVLAVYMARFLNVLPPTVQNWFLRARS